MSDTGWIGIMYCVIFYFGGVLMGYLIGAQHWPFNPSWSQ
jgi:hypothetical protein